MDGRSQARGAGFCRRHGRATLGSTVLKVMGGADDINRCMMMGPSRPRDQPLHGISAEAPQGEAMETHRLVFSGEGVPQPMRCLMGSTRVWEGHVRAGVWNVGPG